MYKVQWNEVVLWTLCEGMGLRRYIFTQVLIVRNRVTAQETTMVVQAYHICDNKFTTKRIVHLKFRMTNRHAADEPGRMPWMRAVQGESIGWTLYWKLLLGKFTTESGNALIDAAVGGDTRFNQAVEEFQMEIELQMGECITRNEDDGRDERRKDREEMSIEDGDPKQETTTQQFQLVSSITHHRTRQRRKTQTMMRKRENWVVARCLYIFLTLQNIMVTSGKHTVS